MIYLKENHQEIDAVIFDLGNVLLDYSPARFLHEVGIPENLHKRISDTLFNDYEVWSKLDAGLLDNAGITEQAVQREPELHQEIHHYMNNWASYFKAIPENVETMYRIKETGTGVYVLSNFSGETFEIMKEHNAFLSDFDGMILSYEHNLIKPQPEIYQLLLDTYPINPKRAVFIDDLLENVEAARKAGLLAILHPACAPVAPYFILPEDTDEQELDEGHEQ